MRGAVFCLGVFCLLALMPGMAVAQSVAPPTVKPAQPAPGPDGTPISKEESSAYYAQCTTRNNDLGQLNPIQQDYLCACVALGLEANITVEGMKAKNDISTPTGRRAMAKYLEHTYFPCAIPVLEETVQKDCLRRARSSTFKENGQSHCACVTGRMMRYVRQVGVPETIYRLTMSRLTTEPFAALMTSSGYTKEKYRAYRACFGENPP